MCDIADASIWFPLPGGGGSYANSASEAMLTR